MRLAAAIAVAASVLSACSSGGKATPRPSTTGAPLGSTTTTAGPTTTAVTAGGGFPPHVLVIVFENHEASAVLGRMPYLDSLVAAGGLATQSFAMTHPSLPNYLELIAGQHRGITSDCTSCVARGSTLADQLDSAGIPWAAYMEGLARPCPTSASTTGGYAKKHDPFAYFPAVMAKDCGRIRPDTSLVGDLGGPAPPAFVWVSPNLCDSAHDCGLDAADGYLRRTVGPVLASPWYRAGGVVIVTFDEGSSNAGCCQVAAGGHIVTVVLAAAGRPRARLDTPVDHAGTLGTIEDLFGLPRLADAQCPCAGSLLPLVR